MESPKIVNILPKEGRSTSPLSRFHFSVRDQDTSVDSSTVFSAVTFSKTEYTAQELPSQVVNSGTETIGLSVFSDYLPRPNPAQTADRRVEVTEFDSNGDQVNDSEYRSLVIEKTVQGSEERGTVFLTDGCVPNRVTASEVELSVGNFSRGLQGNVNSFQDPDYVGVVLGMTHWRQNKAVFVFFMEDPAGAKYLYISQPPEELPRVGVSIPFDWSAHEEHSPFVYRIVWDDSGYLNNHVYVLVTDPSTDRETLLFSGAIDSKLPEESRMGLINRINSPDGDNRITVFAGIDAGDPGDFIELRNLRLDTFGVPLVSAGRKTEFSTVESSTSDSLLITTYEDTFGADREEVNDTIIQRDNEAFIIRKSVNEPPLNTKKITFKEPDLLEKPFLLFFNGSVRDSQHPGSHTSGAGIDIYDGTKAFKIRFLDDFTAEKIGILSGDNVDNALDYHTIDSPWSTITPKIGLMVNRNQPNAGDFSCKLVTTTSDISWPLETRVKSGFFTGNDHPSLKPIPSTDSKIIASEDDLPDSNEEPGIRVGYLDNSISLSDSLTGELTVSEIFVLPACDFLSRQNADPSKFQGAWDFKFNFDRELDGLGFEVPLHIEEYGFYSRLLPEYIPNETGVTLLLDVRLNWRWSTARDIFLMEVDTSRLLVPSSPIAAIHVGNGLYLQLQFVAKTNTSTNTSRVFMFVSQDPQDYIEVLNRTELGKLISFEIPPIFSRQRSRPDTPEGKHYTFVGASHTYIISYQPGKFVRVYFDYDFKNPAIDIPWKDKDVVAKSSCNPEELTPDKATVAVGSISLADAEEGRSGPISYRLAMAAVSVGSGFNYISNLSLDSETMEDKVYSSKANLLIDTRDRD